MPRLEQVLRDNPEKVKLVFKNFPLRNHQYAASAAMAANAGLLAIFDDGPLDQFGMREHEMDEVIATLNAINVDGIMSKATKSKLNWCTGLGLKEHFKGVPPKDFHEIFAALDKI